MQGAVNVLVMILDQCILVTVLGERDHSEMWG